MSNGSKKRISSWATIVGTAIFFTVGFISVIENRSPSNIMRPSGELPAYSTASVIKQGWTFFTRDGREPKITLLKKTEEGFKEASVDSDGLGAILGFSRAERLLGFETSMLLEKHPFDTEGWVECTSTQHSECAESAPLHSPIDLEIRGRFACGEAALIAERPIPLSYANLTDRRETKALRIYVNCPG
jgi:hypothetical protein